uniref:Uncharacterized protein n=1 Tax=Triticum urartu TaxID=4572 RepID=A0A8R7UP17_TRIUA
MKVFSGTSASLHRCQNRVYEVEQSGFTFGVSYFGHASVAFEEKWRVGKMVLRTCYVKFSVLQQDTIYAKVFHVCLS